MFPAQHWSLHSLLWTPGQRCREDQQQPGWNKKIKYSFLESILFVWWPNLTIYLFVEVFNFYTILLTISIAQLTHDKVHNGLINFHFLFSSNDNILDAGGFVPENLGWIFPRDSVHFHVTGGPLLISVPTTSSGHQVKAVEKTRHNLRSVMYKMNIDSMGTCLLLKVLYLHIILLTVSIAELAHCKVHNCLVHLHSLWSSQQHGDCQEPGEARKEAECGDHGSTWHGVPASSRNSGSDRSDVLYGGTITSHIQIASSLTRQTTFCRNYVALIKAGIVAT